MCFTAVEEKITNQSINAECSTESKEMEHGWRKWIEIFPKTYEWPVGNEKVL